MKKNAAETTGDLEGYLDNHYIHRSNWLRAAVLGANDGILSTASIAIGVAAASAMKEPVILATVAGLVAGALSMAAGEYVSVSSQTDVENADLEREKIDSKNKQTRQRKRTRASEKEPEKGAREKSALSLTGRGELGLDGLG